MRWTLIVLLCVAAASAKYKNRFGQMLQNIADFENELESELVKWSDEDSDEIDDDLYQEPQDHYRSGQKKKQHRHSTRPKQQKWQSDDDSEDYDSDQTEYAKKESKHQPPKQPCQPNYDLLEKLDAVNAHLAARLHQGAKELADDKNIVVSPVAVQLSLAALAQGARENTKQQISQLLDNGLGKGQNQDAYAALVRTLKTQNEKVDSKSAQIKCTTNLILGKQSAQESFVESIKNCFDSEVRKCDFRQKPQQCRDQINQWIATKTGLKSQIISQTGVTSNTKMVSIGTLQVKAKWGKQFRKNLKSSLSQFYPLGEQTPTPVKVVQSEGQFNYFEDEQVQMLGIQTEEKLLTMYVMLPKTRHGLSRLEKQRLQYGKQLQQLLHKCDNNKLTVKAELPTFQIVHAIDIKPILTKLGIEDAFDNDMADFTGISHETGSEDVLEYGRRQTGGLEDIEAAHRSKQEHQLHLNKMMQVAAIQIDENGIDAPNDKSQQKVKQSKSDNSDRDNRDSESSFKADHAFAVVLKHNPTNQVLLMARVIDATQKVDTNAQMDFDRA